MANYITYDKEICVGWFNSDKYLFDCLQYYKEVLEDEGVKDKFAQKARLRVFYNIVCTDEELFGYYQQLLRNKHAIPDIEVVDELDNLIRRYTWKRVFMSLRFVVKRYLKLESKGSVNERRLEKSLDKLREIPFLTTVPPNKQKVQIK